MAKEPKKKTKETAINKMDYLDEWKDYQDARPGQFPILLPVSVDIVDGQIVRDRIKAGDVKKLYMKCRDEIPHYMFDEALGYPNPDEVFDDYDIFFGPQDGVQSPIPDTPLDLHVCRPVWNLFHLPRKNWCFSKKLQYSVVGDRDDMRRNFVKICTLDSHNYLLVENRCRSKGADEEDLKFNLHVAIQQEIGGNNYITDIIIDPDQNNDDEDTPYAPPGGGGPPSWP